MAKVTIHARVRFASRLSTEPAKHLLAGRIARCFLLETRPSHALLEVLHGPTLEPELELAARDAREATERAVRAGGVSVLDERTQSLERTSDQ